MIKTYTCIICPNGCDIDAEIIDSEILSTEGDLCPRGREYIGRELHNPERNIASSVLVSGGEIPLVSVRLTAPVPKARIFDVMREIKGLSINAPVHAGDVLIPDVLGLNCDVIATKNVNVL